jgi:predicted transcriptional regulator
MLSFLKHPDSSPTSSSSLELGPLEMAVMEILWAHGETNVREVAERLGRPLAYTTVMTTMDRLYKKHFLVRRKFDRAFRYAVCLSRAEWESKRAGNWVAAFLSNAEPSGEMLISCLVDAVGQKDVALLDELEKRVKEKRRELNSGGKS